MRANQINFERYIPLKAALELGIYRKKYNVNSDTWKDSPPGKYLAASLDSPDNKIEYIIIKWDGEYWYTYGVGGWHDSIPGAMDQTKKEFPSKYKKLNNDIFTSREIKNKVQILWIQKLKDNI